MSPHATATPLFQQFNLIFEYFLHGQQNDSADIVELHVTDLIAPNTDSTVRELPQRSNTRQNLTFHPLQKRTASSGYVSEIIFRARMR